MHELADMAAQAASTGTRTGEYGSARASFICWGKEVRAMLDYASMIFATTVNPLYNDTRYNSKIRHTVNFVSTKISGSCIVSLIFPFYSTGEHTFCVFVKNRLGRRF